jgi:structural maintenance of chromosome 4
MVYLYQGRLGSLGTIPDKYDVAISTACGGLHHMVVDRVDQAQACIQYLRDQDLGRATFTVLEKLKDKGMDKMPTPENVPRLFDLVQPKEPRFAKAFYKALSDTLVADDMEQANRIAFGAKRYRVVTLAGQIIDINGGMSGGGNNPARGAMSSKFAPEAVSPEVLRALEQESTAAERALDQVMNVIQSAETELDRLKKAAPEIETAFQKLGLDIENGKKRISEAQKRISDLK